MIPAPVADRSAAFAAGALSSNVSDLVAWDNALINGKVVSPASFTAMTTPVSSAIPGGGSYGFGLVLRTFNNQPTIWTLQSMASRQKPMCSLIPASPVECLTNSECCEPRYHRNGDHGFGSSPLPSSRVIVEFKP